MTLCKQIQERATYLAALSEKELERQEAFAHARTCVDCLNALETGARVVSMLDSVPVEHPSAEAMVRASSLILAELDSKKSAPRSYLPTIPISGAILLSCAVLFLWATPYIDLRLGALALLLVSLSSLLSAVLPQRLWSTGLWVFASVLLGGATSGGAWHGHGLLCLWMEVSVALIPLAVGAYLVAKDDNPGGVLFFAQVAAASAFAGQAIMLLTCPNTNLAHILLAHTGGVVLSAAMGGALSKAVLQRA